MDFWGWYDAKEKAFFSFWENMSVRNTVVFSLLVLCLVIGGLGWYFAFHGGVSRDVAVMTIAVLGGMSMLLLSGMLIWRFTVVPPSQTQETPQETGLVSKSFEV